MHNPNNILGKALDRKKLGHALLFYGPCIETLLKSATELSAQLLKTEHPTTHPDYFLLRPANKMRQIGVEPTRELIHNLQQTPLQGERKVGIVLEADRFHGSSANAFLKTLEEPAEDTTLILLTTRLHAVLPTLRSRCQLYAFPEEAKVCLSEDWETWLKEYAHWLSLIRERPTNAEALTQRVMTLYRLIVDFENALTILTDLAWEKIEPTLATLTDEEKDALEVGTKKSLRRRLFQDIAQETRNQVVQNAPSADRIKALTQAIDILEHHVGLLEVNLNEAIALEAFFLKLMRLWISKS